MYYDIYGKNRITGKFGDKRSYYKKGHYHQGDDIALPLNSPIYAVSGGKVVKIGNDPQGYGKYIDVLHPNGYTSRYAHSNGFNVKVGDEVSSGQAIGLVGQTGRATGPHIHFEVMKDGQRLNPRDIAKYFGGETTGPLNALNTDVIKQKGIINMADNGVMTGAAANIEDLKNQIAENQVRERMKLTPEEEELKKQSIANLLSRLQNPVEVPQKLTIQDIINGDTLADRLRAGAEYMNQPDFQRNIGNLMGTRLFNAKTGRFENTGDRLEQEAQARFDNEREHLLEQQKLQDVLNTKAYDSMNDLEAGYMTNDIRQMLADQNLAYQMQKDKEARDYQAQRDAEARAWEKEKLDREEALEREKIAARYGGGVQPSGTITGGAALVGNNGDISKLKMTAADRKQLTENKTTLKNIEAGLQSLEENPNAYSFLKGIMGSNLTNRIDPKGVSTRTQIDNITAVYRKWLTGAQMSDKERIAYERFLPAPTDNYNIVKAKLNGMKGAIERSNEALLSNYGVNSEAETQGNADPLGLGL